LIQSWDGDDSALALARRNIREGRIFALTLAGGFAFIALVGMRKGHHRVMAAGFSAAVICLLAALLIPAQLKPARRAWMKLGEAIGYVTTPVIMAIVYYVILTPLGVVRRVTAGRRPVKDSHWYRRPPLPPASRMERQF